MARSRLTRSTCDLGSSTFCDLRRVTHYRAVIGFPLTYTYIIPQMIEKVNLFCEKNLHKFTPREPQLFVQVAGPAPGQASCGIKPGRVTYATLLVNHSSIALPSCFPLIFVAPPREVLSLESEPNSSRNSLNSLLSISYTS